MKTMKSFIALAVLLAASTASATKPLVYGYVVDSSVTKDPRKAQTVAVPAGETSEIDIYVARPTGATYDLTGGQLLLTVVQNGTTKVSRQATVDVAASGIAHFPLVVADTQSLSGTCSYDVWVTDSSGNRYQVVPLSTFSVLPANGKPGQLVTAPTSQTPLAQGPTGPQGPAGPQGPQGPAGSSSTLTSAQAQGTLTVGGNILGTDGADVNTVKRYQTAEASGPAWYEWFSDFSNPAGDGHKDQGYAFGWNENATGIVNPLRGAFGFHIENDYQPASNKRQIEQYFTAYNPADATIYRPFSITVDLLNAGPPTVGVAATSFGLQKLSGGANLWSWTLGDGSGTAVISTPSGNTSIVTGNNNVTFWQGTNTTGGHPGLLTFDNTNRLLVGDYNVPVVHRNDLYFYDAGNGAQYDDGGTNVVMGTSGKLNLGYTGAPINSGIGYRWKGYRYNGQNFGTSYLPGLELLNGQPATAGAQQYSPSLHFQGSGWNPTGSLGEFTDWYVQHQAVQLAAGSARGDLVGLYAPPGGGTPSEKWRFSGDGALVVSWYSTNAGAQLTAASTITPTNAVHHVTGSTTINTIATTNLPAGRNVELLLIVDNNALSISNSGNVAAAVTAAPVGHCIKLVYIVADGKWYPQAGG